MDDVELFADQILGKARIAAAEFQQFD